MDNGCLPFALQSVLETLITKCHLTSWDIHGKGKTTTLVLRWDSDNMAAIARPDQSESVSFARYRKKSPSELRRDAHRAMTRQQQLLAQGQSVKPSKDDISSTQVTDTNFASFESPATQPNPPFTIDDDSSDDSEKVQEEYVIAKENEPDKEQNDSFSETTHEMFCDVHSGTVEEEKDQIRQFCEEQRGTIGYYLSTLEEEERNAVVASAENHTVQKVVCDHRYGKYSLFAMTTGILFEYDLKTGVVKDWLASYLKYGTVHLNKTTDCVKRWPEVDPLRYSDHIDKMKQHIEFCCRIIQQHGV